MQEKTFVEPYGFVYITTNMVNGKKYVGQRMFSAGWQTYLGSGNVFKKALKRYGKNNFVRNIVQICYSEQELNDAEYQISVFLDVVESDDYYNLVYGGGTSRGWHPSQETKDKIGAKAKERLANPQNHPMYGKQGLSGEYNPMFGVSPKERMDEEIYQQWYDKHVEYWTKRSVELKGKCMWGDGPNPNCGKHLSDERKENLSKKARDRFQNIENHPMYGKHHSEESKKKMSESRRKMLMHRCKHVYCIELQQCFYAATEAGEVLGVASDSVRKCCKGQEGRKSAGRHPVTNVPLHWLYTEDAVQQGYLTQQTVDEYLNNIKEMESNI
jgi:group I intron endonuclease